MKRIEELNAVLVTNAELKAAIEAIGWRDFIAEIKKGFEQSSLGYSITPPKVYVNTDVSDMRCMPSYLPKYNPRYCGVKIVCVAPANKKIGIPTVLGEYLLRDAETQQLLAIMQAEEMTAFRTGAATGVATDALARRDCGTPCSGYSRDTPEYLYARNTSSPPVKNYSSTAITNGGRDGSSNHFFSPADLDQNTRIAGI